jgi:hypothetical protein
MLYEMLSINIILWFKKFIDGETGIKSLIVFLVIKVLGECLFFDGIENIHGSIGFQRE